MKISQELSLKRILASKLTQSLNILSLSTVDINELIQSELESNPLLEQTNITYPKEAFSVDNAGDGGYVFRYSRKRNLRNFRNVDFNLQGTAISKKASLYDILLRQLGMFVDTDQDFRIGQEIIGNIDENGYLRVNLEEIAHTLNVGIDNVGKILNLIQQFEPIGVGARTVSECLLIQLKLINEENSPLLAKIISNHLDDIAKKDYSRIAKELKEPKELVELLINKVIRLNPKPGRNYSSDEAQKITPDIIITEKYEDEDGTLEVVVNNEDDFYLTINKTYRDMLKDDNIDLKTKEFLKEKFRNASELLEAISKRKQTLRKVAEVIATEQQEALKKGLSYLKPFTFQDVAQKLNIHESTVCRAVMNKYVQLPFGGVVALKDFFTSHVYDRGGQQISSNYVKRIIKELVDKENRKRPLSDENIRETLFKEKEINVSRRAITKYREELKILSSPFRRER